MASKVDKSTEQEQNIGKKNEDDMGDQGNHVQKLPQQLNATKKEGMRSLIFSEESEDDRFRTPSGTQIPKLQAARSIFSPSSNHSERVLNSLHGNISCDEVNHDTACDDVDMDVQSTESIKTAAGALKHGKQGTLTKFVMKAKRAKNKKNEEVPQKGLQNSQKKRKVLSDERSDFESEEINKSANDLRSSSDDDDTSVKSYNTSNISMDEDLESENNMLKAIAQVLRYDQAVKEHQLTHQGASHHQNAYEYNLENAQASSSQRIKPIRRRNPKRKAKKTDQADSDSEEETEQNMQGNPKVISAASVMEMFQVLKKKMDNLEEVREKDLRDLDLFKENCKKEVAQSVNDVIALELAGIKSLKAEVAHLKFKSELQSEIMDRMHSEMMELTQKIENLELASSKKMVVMSGIDLDQQSSKESKCYAVQKFINDNIGLSTIVEDVFFIGVKDPRSFVVTFQSMADKQEVMRNKQHLKGVSSDNQQPVYINNYTPIATQEKRRRENDIIQEVDEDQISYAQGGVVVQGEPYKKKITVPTPKELIEVQPEEMRRILKIPMGKGSQVSQQNSRFTAYTAAVSSHQQVRDMYKKMKYSHPDVRHIVCAFWLTDTGMKDFYNKDYQDDGEPGAGRRILQMMMANNLKSRVIFVARKYGGIRMGAERFECYETSAKAAVIANPYNEILQCEQAVTQNTAPGVNKTRSRNPNSQGNTKRGARRPQTNRGGARGANRGAATSNLRGPNRGSYSNSVPGAHSSTQSGAYANPSRYGELSEGAIRHTATKYPNSSPPSAQGLTAQVMQEKLVSMLEQLSQQFKFQNPSDVRSR